MMNKTKGFCFDTNTNNFKYTLNIMCKHSLHALINSKLQAHMRSIRLLLIRCDGLLRI